MKPSPIYVTEPSLPPLENLVPLLEEIWERKVLTNAGPFHKQLEQELCEYLDVKYVSLFANGTLALMIALKALRISGEVITTPYSFVATAHALVWNNLKPVFIDIEPDTLNLDPGRIEAAITPRTTAILPVHCYGNPCKVDEIGRIAVRHGLKVIYDAAHAFGVKCHCGSLLNHGDLSVLSFHATKVFNTLEGGAIICHDAAAKSRIDQLRNFGFATERSVLDIGLNGKMNEVQAALGLLQLRSIDEAIARRAVVDSRYRETITSIPGLDCVPIAGQKTANYSYFPILVGDDYYLTRDELVARLEEQGVYARRYFHPLISDFVAYHEVPAENSPEHPVASSVAERVICLPIYPSLSNDDQDRILKVLSNSR